MISRRQLLIGASAVTADRALTCKGAPFDWASIDGMNGAPIGASSVQHPNLLSGYVLRPPWNVAGVDYYVGVPPNIALKDPATLSSSGSVYVDRGSGWIWVDGGTLDGYDLTKKTAAGGKSWTVLVKGSGNSVIQNCNLKVDATRAGQDFFCIRGYFPTGPLLVQNCTIDGNGTIDNGTMGALIGYGAALTVQYCWLKNSPNDIIDCFANPLIRWNLFDTMGLSPKGNDADGIQMEGGKGNTTPTVVFNTFYQPAGVPLANCGFQWTAQGGTGCNLVNGRMSNNTLIAKGRNVIHFLVGIGPMPPATVSGSIVQSNYMDDSGCDHHPGFFYPHHERSNVFSDNRNMRTGAVVDGP